jgi:nitrite reductase/ring-hydroxylating ferredoxin subunit
VGFVKVGELSEVPVGEMKMFKVGEKEYLVANVNGNYCAIGNRCTHASGNISEGSLEGNVATCPRHKSKFDSPSEAQPLGNKTVTGKVISGPKLLFVHPKINNEPSYEVKVKGNALLLKTE